MEYNNEKRFVLFKNDKKGNDKAPDMKGHIEIDGIKYYLSAWSNETKNGEKYLSGLAELPRENNENNQSEEDDLPF